MEADIRLHLSAGVDTFSCHMRHDENGGGFRFGGCWQFCLFVCVLGGFRPGKILGVLA